MIQRPANGGLNQQWRPIAAGSAWYLLNVNSGMVLEVPGGSTSQRTQLAQSTSFGATYQQWSVNPVGNGAYTLANVDSGQFADVNGASTTQNATVIQWPGNGGAKRQRYLTLDY